MTKNSTFIFKFFFVSVGLLSSVGCLKTRNDVRETETRQVMQQQVTTLQRTNADVSTRFLETDERMRELIGRVEELENKINSGNQNLEIQLKASQQGQLETNQKVVVLQEALGKMEAQVLQLTAELQALRAEPVGRASTAPASKNERETFAQGQDLFAQKEWKKAILLYQKYRDENPRGKNFAEATYKIGVSFQELGMKDEAKTFYEEVIASYGKTESAKKAKTRLKGLK